MTNVMTQPDSDPEEVYYQGSPMLRAHLGRLLFWTLIAAALVAAIILLKPGGVVSLVLLVLALIALLIPSLLTRTTNYRITSYRIDISQGLLARNTDTIELWHVEDLRLHQSILDRMLNVGTITVLSHNDTNPQLGLRGIPHPHQLFTVLEQRVIAVKRQRGVVKLDTGQ